MKLSENTIDVLKNFSSINQGLVVKPGSTVRTISSNKAVLAEAVLDETFDQEFGIYDLNKLLGLLSLNKQNPEVEVEKEFLVFRGLGGSGKIRQRFTPSNLILTPPNKSINVQNYEVNFEFTPEVHEWIFNVASILKCPNIVIKGNGEDLAIWAMDVKGEIVDDANATVKGSASTEFSAVLKIDNLKIVPGAYSVEISSVGVSKFTHTTKKLVYWIAIEQASSSFTK